MAEQKYKRCPKCGSVLRGDVKTCPRCYFSRANEFLPTQNQEEEQDQQDQPNQRDQQEQQDQQNNKEDKTDKEQGEKSENPESQATKGAKAGQKVGETAQKAQKAEQTAGKTAKVAQKAGQAAKGALAGIRAAIAAGGLAEFIIPILIIVGAIIIIIIIVIVIFSFIGGFAGQSGKTPINPNNAEDKALLSEFEGLTTNKNSRTGLPNVVMSEPEKKFVLGQDPVAIKKVGYVDRRVLRALIYLGQHNDYIKIQSIIYPYVDIPAGTLETHSDKDQEAIANVTAHKQGQAFDISEIGMIYKQATLCCDDACKTNNILNYSCKKDDCKLVCPDPCAGNSGPQCAANTAQCEKTNSCTPQIIPVQVGWQEKSTWSNMSAAAFADIAKGQIEDAFGLPNGSLNGDNPESVIKNYGAKELERYLKLPENSIDLNDGDILSSDLLGRRLLEEQWGLKEGSLSGNNLKESLITLQSRAMEESLKLIKDSIAGDENQPWSEKAPGMNDPGAMAKNTGVQKIAKEFNLKPADFKNSETLKTKIQSIVDTNKFTDDQLKKMATDMKLPENSILDLFNTAKAGGNPSGPLIQIGSTILNDQFGLDPGTWNKLIEMPDIRNTEIRLVIPDAKLTKIDTKLGVPAGFSANLFTALKNRQDVTAILQSEGAKKLDVAMNLPEGSISNIISGRVNIETILQEQGLSISDFAGSLGVSADAMKSFLSANSPVGQYYEMYKELAAGSWSESLKVDKDAALKYIKGQINYEDFLGNYGINLDQLSQITKIAKGNWGLIIKGANSQGLFNMGGDFMQSELGIDPSSLMKGVKIDYMGNVDAALGLPEGTINSVFTGSFNPQSLISMGLSMIPGLGFLSGNCLESEYQGISREYIHKTDQELLNMSTELNDPVMKPTQIITLSDSRDVQPFATEIDNLYGKNRQPNYGLFSMKEMQNRIHVGY